MDAEVHVWVRKKIRTINNFERISESGTRTEFHGEKAEEVRICDAWGGIGRTYQGCQMHWCLEGDDGEEGGKPGGKDVKRVGT